MDELDRNVATFERREDGRYHCAGAWTVANIPHLETALRLTRAHADGTVVFNGTGIARMDSAGAWLLHRTRKTLEAAGSGVSISGLRPELGALLEMVAESGMETVPQLPPPPGVLEQAGRGAFSHAANAYAFLQFAGECMHAFALAVFSPKRIRWPALLADIYTSGVNALPIVGLLTFLMGLVIAFQGAAQLQQYGASVYVVDLVGLSLVRELAPLMAAIIVAGRTGAAYTAQIGTMVVTEEVSALRTIGIPPIDQLVLPKLISLLLVLPLLSFYADVMGLLGGMLMVKLQLGLSPTVFMDRLADAVSMRSFMIGFGKTPVFAAIIAIIGCYQGFQVRGGAESVGHHTTLSVVHSIFWVIVADALFSVLFSWLGLLAL